MMPLLSLSSLVSATPGFVEGVLSCTWELYIFPNILHEMKGVEFLRPQGNCTNELPPSFGNLIGLKDLTISTNSGEAHLPSSIYNLQSIETLELDGEIIFPKNWRLIDSQCATLLVALPKSMSRCERLHMLTIRDCHSLDLQSFCQPLPEIIGLPPNLPPCLGVTSHMLMFPHSSTMLQRWQNPLCECSFDVTGDENDIPNWFNHQRDGNLISFSIGPEFPTIALCVAFGIQDSCCHFDYYVFVSINGSERTFERKFIEIDRSFGHLSFSCRPQSSLQGLQLTDWNHVEILCETLPRFSYTAPIVERIGVHVECNCPPPQNPSIIQDINRHLSLQSGLGLPLDTENGSDFGSAFDSSNVDGFDLGSSSVAQPVTPQVKRKSKKRNRKIRSD